MSRYRAATFHLLICVIVAAALFGLFWFLWYPQPLFRALGGIDVFLMLLCIDVILGPLLTFIVFKAGKRSLKFDLATIGCVQIAALAYGVFVLFAGRPVYVAALGHRFDLIQATDIDPEELRTSGASLPKWGPKVVGTKRATDQKERDRVMFGALLGVDYGHYPQHHAPIELMRDELLVNAQPIAKLREINAARDADISVWLARHAYDDNTAIFQGLKARTEDMAVILDAKTAAVIGIAPFKPWD